MKCFHGMRKFIQEKSRIFLWLGSDLEPTWQIIKLLNTLKDIWTIKTQPSQLQQNMQGEASIASLLETTTFNLSKDFYVEKKGNSAHSLKWSSPPLWEAISNCKFWEVHPGWRIILPCEFEQRYFPTISGSQNASWINESTVSSSSDPENFRGEDRGETKVSREIGVRISTRISSAVFPREFRRSKRAPWLSRMEAASNFPVMIP